ncbi:uncharacterized protein [Spinacia oleracea]|uniref:Integrase catalytic domain-containing protein n=1 Tax=Spinacia oleracea TaxID=3562 RepID=A0ABM3RPL9_SPIOL|nr:uncharacterized protein LOC130471450 [Spinacia oleracea]
MDHLDDLPETFETLRTYQMRLNPKKCIFGVSSGKFLGFLTDERGIKANSDKVQAVINMTSPRTVKDVQRLTGCLAALGRFLSRAGDKCHYFFSTIRKGTQFEWTPQAETAFLRLKEHPYTLPRLNAELKYPTVENFGFALFLASKKFRPYFLAHRLIVYTYQPLKRPFTNLEDSGRMLNWAIELNAFDISYEPRKASDNEAEYEALICGIQMSKAAGAADVLVLSNSQLIVSQVKGEYEAKDDAMIKYLEKVRQEVQQLSKFEIQHIPRSENNKADALSKLASSASCDTPRGRALAEKALRTGYYWPTLKEDALDLVKWCAKCQRFSHLIRRPAQRLTPITIPIPFAKWGMDLLGPYMTAPGGLRYVIVAVDYFTKWVEAEALKNTKAQDVRAFIWKNIITRFGGPGFLARNKRKRGSATTAIQTPNDEGVQHKGL